MKKLTILIVLATITFAGKSQGFLDAGLKAGLNTSKLSTHSSDYTPQTINGYQFGAFARINFGRFYVQPEAYFNSKGGEYIYKISPSTVNSFNLKSVDVPALLGFKIVDQKAFNLRILAGPTFSFLTDKSVSVKGQLTKDNLENSFFGWQYGVGADFLFLTLDVRKVSYSKDFYSTPNFDFDSKNGTFVISLGVKLF
jgi:hypothetical protein